MFYVFIPTDFHGDDSQGYSLPERRKPIEGIQRLWEQMP
jgi:hypothetical protein